MSIHSNPDTPNRDRTITDRKAFVLSEQTAAMAVTLMPKPAEAAPVVAMPTDPRIAATKSRAAMREAAAAARKGAALHAMGELVYRALPLDEAEKAPFREAVLSQTVEMVKSLGDWNLTKTGTDLLEAAGIAADSVESHDLLEVQAAVAESVASGELSALIERVGAEVENRVIAALADSRERSMETEQRLAEATALATGDAELDQTRIRRAQRSAPPTLIEALFVANRRMLSEGTGQEVAAPVLMIEAVSQYTLLEALSSIGVITLEKLDVENVARRLVSRKEA
jgi:hypothetical protein